MSGTASRSQTRLTYSPALRVAPVLGALGAPGDGYTAPPSALPALAGLGSLSIPASVASPVGPPVMSGSRAFRREDGDGSEGGMGAQTGAMTGVGSTGSVLGDINAIASTFGPAAGVAFGSPTGVFGATLGGLIAGGLRAAGAKEAANAVVEATFGIDASQGGTKSAPDPADMGAPPSGFGPQEGTKPDALGFGDGGGDAGGSVGPDGNPSDGSAGSAGNGDGGGVAGDAGGSVGPDGNPSGGWMRGGYTGHGQDGIVQADQPAGTVHEGEVVIPASQVARYGLDPLLMLARGQVEPSRLMALLRG